MTSKTINNEAYVYNVPASDVSGSSDFLTLDVSGCSSLSITAEPEFLSATINIEDRSDLLMIGGQMNF